MSVEEFVQAQRRILDRYGVEVESQIVDVPVCKGQAQVLVSGGGPPVVMVNGIGTPSAMFAPMMAQMDGFRIYGVDLPGFGLTDAPADFTDNIRSNAVTFLEQVLDGLGLDRPAFVANSLGGLWTSWLALERPARVAGLVHIGCPALLLDTSAPLPMRLLSVPPLGRLMMRLQPPSPKQVEQLSKMAGEYPLPPEIAELILATERLPGSDEFFLSTLHALVRPRGSRPEVQITEEQLAQIGQPVLYIWGDGDPFGSVDVGRRAASILQDGELQVIPGGHVPWVRSAERAGELATNFLQGLDIQAERS